ncbi:MAG: antibiotic biosynthesis monooxygenase [Corynebacterium sp.]|uniref:antibiotic biosynthesis monooxygenase family protein n=1 Tax=Corynebacterium sp. TaxID=1720 RepID=UPI0026DD64E1|nr:antibiotic biosynthesis monooxygenase [Corynebacterium sp.]MDO5099674.1 antibiotic biosynthesis monooxygenase [Corynebacterium sp.]
MSIVKINALEVPAENRDELEKRFAARKHAVDNQPGFRGFKLLRPVEGEDRYFVVTEWDDEESYEAWRAAEAQAGGHGGHGAHDAERKPAATGATLMSFEVVLDSRD